jgi:hypothetical protein
MGIPDSELSKVVRQLMLGQGDDLGGGVWKKRMSRNANRAIVLAKGRRHYFFVFVFAKNAMQNIQDDELQQFRKLAGIYAAYGVDELVRLCAVGALLEIEHEK